MKNDRDILLAKWLDGSIQREELAVLQKEFDLDTLQDILQQQQQLDIVHRPVADMWTDFEKKLVKEKEPSSSNNLYKKITILVLILAAILAGWFLFKQLSSGKTIETKPGEQQEELYADGTRIQISPSTKLVYNERDWDTKRQFKLDGQAYFEVSKGTPFIVETRAGSIEVLGTSFDIWAIDNNNMRVQCFEGKVKVSTTTQSVILNKEQEVVLNNKGLNAVNSFGQNRPDWLQAQRIYNGSPVGLVLKDMSRFYAIEIINDQLDITTQFSGVIPLNDIEKAVRYLGTSMNWQYKIDKNVVRFSPN